MNNAQVLREMELAASELHYALADASDLFEEANPFLPHEKAGRQTYEAAARALELADSLLSQIRAERRARELGQEMGRLGAACRAAAPRAAGVRPPRRQRKRPQAV